MKIVIQNVFMVLFFATYNYLCLAKDSITIGALFDEEDSQMEMPLRSLVYTKNLVDQKLFYKINMQTLLKTDSYSCSKIVCNISQTDSGIAAIFGPQSEGASSIIQSLCSNFEIPHIQTNWKAKNSPKSETALNFFPEADLYAMGLAEIVKSLQWDSFIVIYETEEGLSRLQEVLKLQDYLKGSKFKITLKKMGLGPDYRPLFKEIQDSSAFRMILDCHVDKILDVLKQAKEIGMLELFHNFFLTSLDAHTLDYSTLDTNANITSIRLFDLNNVEFKRAVRNWELSQYHLGNRIKIDPQEIRTETVLMHDAVLLFLDTLNTLQLTQTIETTPISCDSTEKWSGGFAISNFMKIKQPTMTLSGPLKFDDFGRRTDFRIHCVEVLVNKTIATWTPSARLNMSKSAEEDAQTIIENLQKTTVIVASRLGKPYLNERKRSYEGEILTGNARYEGYAMDLINGIAEILNFTYEFKVVKDYGKPDPITGKWNGLVRELIDRKAHLAICDLTITHQRREVVDFSMPFMTLGIGILHKKPDAKEVNMFAFLDPFSLPVWFYTATLYLIVSLLLFFVSRMTPGDWESPHPCDQNPEELENIWDFKNSCWLTMGSIMTQGCDILPKGISSRMSVSMWWFFSLIMTSSYTANLAAFLTMQKMEPAIDGAEALSKQNKIKYGTVEGGSTQAFFRDSNYSTYQRMWLSMSTTKPSVFENNNDEGVDRVISTRKGLYAFLMESSQIEYFVQTKCELKSVGNWLDSKGYGIAMPMNSPYRGEINKAVLKMSEDGKLIDLKTKWWKTKREEPSCDDSGGGEDDSSKLALANVGGVFLVLGLGISFASILSIIEFLWNVRCISIEEHMTYSDALKMELKFVCNVWITKKRTRPETSDDGSTKEDSKSILQNGVTLVNENNKNGSNENIDDKE
ncbi:unnamed protein product [Brassicogethes aeneus]|uniref:Uncharacterized protein n=1 Tax=Brassicogethes aeneus TaxID=1431903 RepID=A0A9P0B340_BRAAE|nr:unnamed protein product [Brassicogethes aeneus]